MPTENINLIFLILVGIALLVVFCVIALFVVFNNRKNTLIQEQLREELKYRSDLHQSELKALRGQLNPHFVHNALNAIQYYVQQNDVETSEYYLSKFSKLMRLFFEYSRAQDVLLSDEIHLLKEYMDIEKLRFDDNFEYHIIIDDDLDTFDTFMPSMILQPIVENAINHGLFHKDAPGKISIAFKSINELAFSICILDNGIGINKANAMKSTVYHNKEHSSSVLEDRLKLLKESKRFHIEYTIKDVSEISNDEGTKVDLRFERIVE